MEKEGVAFAGWGSSHGVFGVIEHIVVGRAGLELMRGFYGNGRASNNLVVNTYHTRHTGKINMI